MNFSALLHPRVCDTADLDYKVQRPTGFRRPCHPRLHRPLTTYLVVRVQPGRTRFSPDETDRGEFEEVECARL